MKTKVVIFTANNARIVINPNDLSYYKKLPNAVIDPDLSEVDGLPPHLWKLQDGKVVPLKKNEQQLRLEDIENRGAINDLDSKNKPEKLKLRNRTKLLLALLIGVGVGILIKLCL